MMAFILTWLPKSAAIPFKKLAVAMANGQSLSIWQIIFFHLNN
jgi:hypothetical protein